MAKHIIILDASSNVLVDDDLTEDVTSFGELKNYLQRVEGRRLAWWENLDVLDSMHNTLQNDSDVLQFGEYDGIENVIILYTKQKQKKTESGVDRVKELYPKIKELNLADKIKAKYGKNFTQVPNAQLQEEINAAIVATTPVEPTEPKKSEKTEEAEEIATTQEPAQKEEVVKKDEPKAEIEEDYEIVIRIPKKLGPSISVSSSIPKWDMKKLAANNPFKK